MYRLTQTCVSKEQLGHKWDFMHSGCLYYYALTKNKLIDVIKIISRIDSVELFLAGDFSNDLLVKFNSELGELVNISYLGEIFGEQKAVFFDSIDVLCLFSRNEGSPIVVAEAIESHTYCWLSTECNWRYSELLDVGIVQDLFTEEEVLDSWALLKSLCSNYSPDRFKRCIELCTKSVKHYE